MYKRQLLSALAGCAVVFIRDTLAPQLGVRVDAIEATAQCETDARGLLGMNSVAPDIRNIGLTIAIVTRLLGTQLAPWLGLKKNLVLANWRH